VSNPSIVPELARVDGHRTKRLSIGYTLNDSARPALMATHPQDVARCLEIMVAAARTLLSKA